MPGREPNQSDSRGEKMPESGRTMKAMLLAAGAMIAITSGTAVAQTAASAPAHAAVPGAPWPHVGSPLAANPAMEARITTLLAAMSDEDKVAQLVQPALASVSAA